MKYIVQNSNIFLLKRIVGIHDEATSSKNQVEILNLVLNISNS